MHARLTVTCSTKSARPRATRSAALLATLLTPLLGPSACLPAADGTSPVLAENEVTAITLMAAWEAGDVEAALDLFWPEAVYDDFPNSTQYRGLTEIGGYVGQVHGWASDVVVNVTAVHVSETGAVAEWVFSGIQSEPIPGRVDVATGREVVLNGVTLLDIENGMIRRAADYIDTLPLLLQLGARLEMPNGEVMEIGEG